MPFPRALVRGLLASTLALCTPVTAPASTTTQAEFTCPIGGGKFTAEVAMSGTQTGSYLDLKPAGPIIAPWRLPKCPDNGFVMFKPEFSDNELRELKMLVRSAKYQAMQRKETPYFLVAWLRRELDHPPPDVAFTRLQATWEAAPGEQYDRYAALALKDYVALVGDPSKEIRPMQRLLWRQLVGELERRLRRFAPAQRRFEALLAEPALKGTPLERVVRQELALVIAQDSSPQRLETGAR